MVRALPAAAAVLLFALFASCGGEGDALQPDDSGRHDGSQTEQTPDEEEGDGRPEQRPDGAPDEDNDKNEETRMKITVRIGGAEFAATLDDGDAGRAFARMLPLTLDMSELNGNEKFFYMDESLPTAAFKPGTIQTGDLLLWGSDCVVLFYKTFSSGYSYTRIGRIDNPEGLAEAVGPGNVSVTFE